MDATTTVPRFCGHVCAGLSQVDALKLSMQHLSQDIKELQDGTAREAIYSLHPDMTCVAVM